MKKFFQEIKADLKFKTAGPGQKLTESPREKSTKEKPKPDAAKCRQGPPTKLRWLQPPPWPGWNRSPNPRPPSSQDAIRNQVKKELMAEAAASDKGLPVDQKNSLPDVEEDPSTLSVSGVYFTCPLTGVTVRKDKRETQIRNAILEHAARDPVAASVMQIHTFNRDREKVKLGVETIVKYLDNIHLHPEEEKYRKIKVQNKVFQERIHCLEGTDQFFQAVGFEKVALDVAGQEEATEDFYVLKDEALEKLDELKEHKEKLMNGEPVRAKLDRQLQIFKPSAQASHFELPSDFFNLTAEELRREQRIRTDAIEKASMLRTKAMREKEEQRELRRYNYTLLRIRFPDGYILQGTFYAREPVSALFHFVRETLQNDWLPFELLAPRGHRLTDENLALNESGLVPSALLTFVWDAEVMEDIKGLQGEHMGSVLKPDLLLTVQMLS